ncbi:MAG: DUF308 domain-containing protein [Prevotellaceae bacterium]|jgi:uncharacterized membrane protein HdeD (DUF308 family)|nr:DUF308 domain-containing protein [Prevotellaceae bacterium]
MKNSTQKTLLTASGVLLAAAGLAALVNPTGITAMLVYLIGFAVLLGGVATAVAAFSPNFSGSRNVLLGLAFSDILLGVLIMLINDIPVLLLGVGVVVSGCSLAVAALQLKKEGHRWAATMGSAVATIVIGLALMLFFRQIQAAIGVVFGVAFLAAGVVLIILAVAQPKAQEAGA